MGFGTSNCDSKINEIEVGKLVKEDGGTWSLKNKGEGLRDIKQYSHFEHPKQ